jgi:hypothetical protein
MFRFPLFGNTFTFSILTSGLGTLTSSSLLLLMAMVTVPDVLLSYYFLGLFCFVPFLSLSFSP